MASNVVKLRAIKFKKSDFSLVSDEIIEVKKTDNIKEYIEKYLIPVLNPHFSVFIPIENTDEKPFFII